MSDGAYNPKVHPALALMIDRKEANMTIVLGSIAWRRLGQEELATVRGCIASVDHAFK